MSQSSKVSGNRNSNILTTFFVLEKMNKKNINSTKNVIAIPAILRRAPKANIAIITRNAAKAARTKFLNTLLIFIQPKIVFSKYLKNNLRKMISKK